MSVISNHSNKFSNKIGISSSDSIEPDQVDFIVGDKVYIASNPEKTGIVTYNGQTKFSDGIWIGVALNQPLGKHNGVVQGVTYFQCDDKHGIFVRKNNLRHISDKILNVFQLETCKETLELENQLNNSSLPKRSIDDKFIVPNPDLYLKFNLSLGDKVCVIGKSSSSTKKIGTLRFIGTTKFAEGVWAGIELDNPLGRNDGSVDGIRYFSCKPQYGLFALETKVQKYNSLVYKNIRNSKLENQSKFGSNESVSSVASNFSSASRTRVRLGMTAIGSNGKTKTENKIKNLNSMTVVSESKEISQGSNAFQKVLKEKEQHVEQLIREREIERIDLASATSKIEELERQLARQISKTNEHNMLFEKKILELKENSILIIQEKEKLLEKLEEEKKKTEDLIFQIEEKYIDESVLENKTEESEHQIFELNEKLAHERDLREALEKQVLEISEKNIDKQNYENIVTSMEMEKLKKEVVQLQNELKEGKQESTISSMIKIIEEKDAIINDIQDRYENLKLKLEHSLAQLKTAEKLNQNQNCDEKSMKDRYQSEILSLKLEVEQLKNNNNAVKSTVTEVDSIIKFNSQELIEKNSELMELSQKILHIENDNVNQIRLKQSAIEEKDRLCAELTAYHEQLEKLRLQISDMHSEKTATYDKLSKARETEINFNHEIGHLKEKISSLTKENLILQENLQISENKHANSNNSTKEMLSQITCLESQIEKLNVTVKSEKNAQALLITKHATLHSELEQMRQNKDDILNLNYEIENLRSINSNLETKNSTLLEKYDMKQKELQVVRERLLKISQEFEDLQESQKNLAQKLERDRRLSADKIRKLEKQLDEPDKKSQFSYSDSCSDKRKSEIKDHVASLKTARDNAEEQISFLNLVIVEREKKFKALEMENEILSKKIKDYENSNTFSPMKLKKIVPPRLYCDVCEMFDFHDTDQCPIVANSSPQSSPPMKIRPSKESIKVPRLYCDICEVFDLHNTSDCHDEQTY